MKINELLIDRLIDYARFRINVSVCETVVKQKLTTMKAGDDDESNSYSAENCRKLD